MAHALDVQLRRMLTEAISNIGSAKGKAEAAQQLNASRKQLLAR